MASPDVLFSRGSSSGFASLVKDPNTLYFLTDTHEIYLGSEKYSIGSDIDVVIQGQGDIVTSAEWVQDSRKLIFKLSDASQVSSVTNAIEQCAQALEAYIRQCVKTVSSDRGSSIVVDSSDAENVKLSLNIASGEHAGNVKLEECSDGLKASVEFPSETVDGIHPGEKVLSIEGNKLKSEISISTEKIDDKTYVILRGIDGQEVSKFDASTFIKDGMLDSVRLEYATDGSNHRVLVFVFNTESGKDEIKVDVQEFIDTYEADPDGGLLLDGNKFSIRNNVTPTDGPLNDDQEPSFGESLVMKTISYDKHGLITGNSDITIKLPVIPEREVGNGGSTLINYVGMHNDGVLYGQSTDVVTSVSSVSTDSQIPTAKAVNDIVSSSRSLWERI